MVTKTLTHLDWLESEAIHIMREVAGQCSNPVLLFSGGKDSLCLLRIAEKAFRPGRFPFPLMHVDTGHNYPEVIKFRDRKVNELGERLIVASVEESMQRGTVVLKTPDEPRNKYQSITLLEAIEKYQFDCCIGGARRDEEKARAKERIMSFRDEFGQWDPKNQRPELWDLYNARVHKGENIRAFPISNWTEMDVWQYIEREKLELPEIYYAHKRDVIKRGGAIVPVTEFTPAKADEKVENLTVRFRTVGDITCTAPVLSDADTVEKIIFETAATIISERGETRLDDQMSEASMEQRKKKVIFKMIERNNDSVLRFMTCGSVDDGKSTLIGRLLFDTKTILTDTLSQIEKTSQKRGMTALDLSLITDGLQAEREQGITIDVAYRYFSTGTRKYIIADAPGHEQYTRNMVTAASTAQVAIILIDARKGILTQTKRHTFLTKLVGIKHILVAVNKMDLVDYNESQFTKICNDYKEFSQAIKANNNQAKIDFLPMSALVGDMIVDRGNNLKWYQGPTLLEYLEKVDVAELDEHSALRFPIQYVCRPQDSSNKDLHDFRGFMGRIESGLLKVRDQIKVLPSGHQSSVKDIRIGEMKIIEAIPEQSITITLDDEIDISRGDMIVHDNDTVQSVKSFKSMICWLSETSLNPGRAYLIMHTTRSSKAKISQIHHKVNVNTLAHEDANELQTNDIAEVTFKLAQPLIVDQYEQNRSTGAFILVDESTYHTVAAGMILSME